VPILTYLPTYVYIDIGDCSAGVMRYQLALSKKRYGQRARPLKLRNPTGLALKNRHAAYLALKAGTPLQGNANIAQPTWGHSLTFFFYPSFQHGVQLGVPNHIDVRSLTHQSQWGNLNAEPASKMGDLNPDGTQETPRPD